VVRHLRYLRKTSTEEDSMRVRILVGIVFVSVICLPHPTSAAPILLTSSPTLLKMNGTISDSSFGIIDNLPFELDVTFGPATPFCMQSTGALFGASMTFRVGSQVSQAFPGPDLGFIEFGNPLGCSGGPVGLEQQVAGFFLPQSGQISGVITAGLSGSYVSGVGPFLLNRGPNQIFANFPAFPEFEGEGTWTVTPEPTALGSLLTGLVGAAIFRRRRLIRARGR
jgi:hypothetical protein